MTRRQQIEWLRAIPRNERERMCKELGVDKPSGQEITNPSFARLQTAALRKDGKVMGAYRG